MEKTKNNIMQEIKCPNCKKIIQEIELEKPHVKRIVANPDKRVKTISLKIIDGKYKWVVKDD